MARKTSPSTDVPVILLMILSVAIPALLTLETVDAPVGTDPALNPTPGGYTVSLTLFLVPLLIIGAWHLTRPRHPVEFKAFMAAVAAIVILGFGLDIVFGYHFFEFPNPCATLGLRLPAWDFARGGWVHDYLPLEEFLFYILGGLFMVTVYLWADRHWLPDYEPGGFADAVKEVDRLVKISPIMIVGCVALLGIGFLVKRAMNPEGGPIPGYFYFQVCLAFFPTIVCFRSVGRFVNWRAFTFGMVALLLISLLYEVTLGVPYGWWIYKPALMLGIEITAWSNLPVEAVLLWLVAGWGAVLAFEFWRVYFHMDRRGWAALFGSRTAESGR